MEIVISEQVKSFLNSLPEKTKQVCINNLKKLANPFPGEDSGDKEKLILDGEIFYRMHINRPFTAFYIIDTKKQMVRVIELLTIEKAHKKYRYK